MENLLLELKAMQLKYVGKIVQNNFSDQSWIICSTQTKQESRVNVSKLKIKHVINKYKRLVMFGGKTRTKNRHIQRKAANRSSKTKISKERRI